MADPSWKHTSNYTQYYVVGDRGSRRLYYCGSEHPWRMDAGWARTVFDPVEFQKDYWWNDIQQTAKASRITNLRLVKQLTTVKTHSKEIETIPLVGFRRTVTEAPRRRKKSK